jgi:hypothetical protein
LLDLPEHEPRAEHGDASKHYGLLWWNNNDGSLPGVPKDAYWSWGLHDSLIVVIPSLDLVVARAGRSWKRENGAAHYDVLKPFLGNIVGAIKADPQASRWQIRWAAPETIVRLAPGSDNWPMTWGDDDFLYTAYGDGWGFEPKLPKKLSLGLARIGGSPQDKLTPENVRAPSIEQVGDDRRGGKASGLLMADGILYMWVRNTGNARLAWSADHAKTWTWADWKLDAGFGCPTFVNYGRNYQGAVDDSVYTFSPDAEDAYTPADRMVMARVPKDRIRERQAYEFFERLDDAGEPRWTGDVTRRGTMFERKGGCYRSNVTWNAPLKRYLWTMTLPGEARLPKGLAVFESTRPWGPWAVVQDANPWDVEAGDSACIPAKWLSADGRSGYLVFAGGDSFSVRRFELQEQ